MRLLSLALCGETGISALRALRREEEKMTDFILENRMKALKNCDMFFSVFHISLHKFWDNVTGFDIVAFDEWLQGKDGDESVRIVVEDKFGMVGVRLIESLL